jgi:putative phage-type endonuclease
MSVATISHISKWSYPEARLVLPADAAEHVWLAERRKGIGGSDAPALFGEAPNQSLYGLWLDKTGQAADTETTDAMRRGNWLEPHLADWFTEKTDIAVRRCGLLVSRHRDHLRTTPDRLSADGGLVEIKTTGGYTEAAKEWRNGGIARHAYIQGQQQLAVTGRSHVWFVVWIDPTPQIRGPIGRDEPLIAQILERADTFWENNVLAGVAPEVDLATLTDEEIALRWPVEVPGTAVEARYPTHVRAMLNERAELKARIRKDEKRAKEIDGALRAMAGDAEALTVEGLPVATFKSQNNTPSVDPALAVDHPDIYARYVTRSTSRRIHIVKTRKAAS